MNNLCSITFRVFSQSLLLTALAFFSFSVSAQQINKTKPPQLTKLKLPSPFDKLSWLECDVGDKVQEKILYEYGAVYFSTAFKNRTVDKKIPCWFKVPNEKDSSAKAQKRINDFKTELTTQENTPIFADFFLQPEAKASLIKVFDEMNGYQNVARICNAGNNEKLTKIELEKRKKKECTKGDDGDYLINKDWALRTYDQTEQNWKTTTDRIRNKKDKGIDDYYYWAVERKYLYDCKNDIKKCYDDQKGNRPIMNQVAIPGSSQHHLGLAIDVNNIYVEEYNIRKCDVNCANTLMRNGWYRTVRYDAYHFTYLGVTYSDKDKKGLETAENELESLGLKKVLCKDTFVYWVPNVQGYEGYKNWECKNVE